MPETVIVDYGMANLRSVQKAFEQVGHSAAISGDPKRVAAAAKVVLPGVGAFRDAIVRLRETGLADAVLRHVDSQRPFLGICLGMQMLFSSDHEDGLHAGLGVFAGLPSDPAVYFVHSYYAAPTDRGIIAAESDYPEPFCAAVWEGNVYATQFHPEKSQKVGLQMLRNFAAT